ncbi:MAG: hypothetical protein ACFE7R_11515 [Candidatus Hodarchaeota archaeon]
MSATGDGVDSWTEANTPEVHPADPLSIDCGRDLIRPSRIALSYPIAAPRIRRKRRSNWTKKSEYRIIWDDTGESILPTVEAMKEQQRTRVI